MTITTPTPTKGTNGGRRSRLPRIGRAGEAERPRYRLTERDRQIILAVYEHRVLATNQVEVLFFPPTNGSKYNSRCRWRLQALYQHGYLQRDEQPQKMTEGRKPLLYFLDSRGAELVAEMLDVPVGKLDWNPRAPRVSPFTLEHLLATNDVRVAVEVSARRHGLEVITWLDDSTLRRQETKEYVILRTKEGGAHKVAIVPDGYFTLEHGRVGEEGWVRHNQFLETDMGTTTGMYAKYGKRDWARKVAAYLQYYRSGKYQEEYGTRSMRVLTVTTSERRLANLKAVTEKVGGKGRFWFTTFEKVRRADVLADPIWHKAGSAELYALV